MKTGVYAIRNRLNDKKYVGGTAMHFAGRWNQHRCDLRTGRHGNQHLQSAWNKHGEAAFEFVILLKCEPSEVLKHEQRFIDTLQATNRDHGYNISPIAGSTRGTKLSESTRQKMSATRKGRKRPPFTDEWRANIAAAHRGVKRPPFTAETRAKMRTAWKTRKAVAKRPKPASNSKA